MQNIVIIGMPSAGKSTIGVILAKTLGMKFIDTDIVIQEEQGKLLQEIINEEGIITFLKVEESIILSLNCKHTIIATGGSVVYSNNAMTHLKQDGVIIYLKVAYEEILRRINNMSTRGIVLDDNQSILDLYKLRTILYEKYYDIIIDCNNKDIESIIGIIVDEIRSESR